MTCFDMLDLTIGLDNMLDKNVSTPSSVISRVPSNVTDGECLALVIYFLSALIRDQLQMDLFVPMSMSRYTHKYMRAQ